MTTSSSNRAGHQSSGLGNRGSQHRVLPIELVLSAHTLSEFRAMAIAPQEQRLAFALRRVNGDGTNFSRDAYHRTGVPWWSLGADIWVTDLMGGGARRLTENQGNNWSPTWSPDGRYLAFCSDRPLPDAPDDEPSARLARLWVWDASTGEQRLVSEVKVRPQQFAWSPDGRRVLLAVLPENITPETYAARAMAEAIVDEPGEEGSTVRVYRGGDSTDQQDAVGEGWSLDRTPVDLAWVDIESGVVERLVREIPVSKIVPSPDGNHIAYSSATRFELAGSQQILYNLSLLTGGEAPRVIAQDIRMGPDGAQFSWAPDGSKLAYRAAGMLADGEVHLVSLDADEAPRVITLGDHRPFARYSADAPFWDATSDHVFFTDGESLWRASIETEKAAEVVALADQSLLLFEQRAGHLLSGDDGASTIVFSRHKKDGTCGFLRVRLDDGAVTELQSEAKAYGGYGHQDGFCLSADGGSLVYAAQDPAHGPDLFVLDLDPSSGSSEPRRLTAINPDLDGYEMGETQIVEWRTVDGAPGRGVLLLPAGYEPGRRYPMITKVYGLDKPSETSIGLFGLQRPAVDNLQLYATRGYAVFLPDVPLSDEENQGTVASDVVKIVLPGVDKVVEMGIADPDRLGLTGHSFGGYNTIAILTRTSRFRAAMMSAGLANLISAYGAMADDATTYPMVVIEQGAFFIHGTPWEKRARYIENSPIFDLDRVQTPLLITHGGADDAVPAFLADEIFVGLRRLGKEVVYARYDGEDHHQAQWSYANQLDYWKRTLDWFDSHLKAPALAKPSAIDQVQERPAAGLP